LRKIKKLIFLIKLILERYLSKIFLKISINYIICFRLTTKINYVYIIDNNILIITIITTAKKNIKL